MILVLSIVISGLIFIPLYCFSTYFENKRDKQLEKDIMKIIEKVVHKHFEQERLLKKEAYVI